MMKEDDIFITYTYTELMNREIKSASRGSHPLSLMQLTITPNEKELIDIIFDLLKINLRDTDTVLLLEEGRIMVILPFTAKAECNAVKNKIVIILESNTLLKKYSAQYNISFKQASYPDDGRTLQRLLMAF